MNFRRSRQVRTSRPPKFGCSQGVLPAQRGCGRERRVGPFLSATASNGLPLTFVKHLRNLLVALQGVLQQTSASSKEPTRFRRGISSSRCTESSGESHDQI